MDTLFIAVGSAILYIVAYRTYGRWLSRKIFNLDPGRKTPASVHEDGKDYVPSHRSMVFGHHFTSIAGTGPIVGPAIAIVWGWLPALIWVLVGSIFIGAVHDFAALVMSLRNQGRTIGDYCGDIINRRVRLLFLIIIMFALWIVIAIFGLVIAVVFQMFPQSVLPVWFQIPISVALGWWVYKRSGNAFIGSIVSVALLYASIWLTSHFEFLQISPDMLPGWISPVVFWTVLLLTYCFIASTLPVHVLLQPRDYINSHQLLLAMGLLALGILWARPEMTSAAPTVRMKVEGAPLLFPFLFITIACGACSGFHCLVSSGVSSKQLKSEGDAQYVGYGAMLLEGMLAVIVILACTAGLGMGFGTENGLLTGAEAWNAKYANWGSASGLGNVLTAVIAGGGNLISSLGIPEEFAMGIIGVFVASFAATTLDSSTRLQRYVISELGNTIRVPQLKNIFVATAIAVISGFILAVFDVFTSPDGIAQGLRTGGKGGMILWPLFGATNQLLAGLALLVATVWLYRKEKPIWITALPMVFMLFVTGWGLLDLMGGFLQAEPRNFLLLSIGAVIFVLELWMVVEAFVYMGSLKALKRSGKEIPELFESA